MSIGMIKLCIAALIPVVAAAIFYLISKTEWFKKLGHWTQQIIIGVVFGAIACLGTEWGIQVNGAVVNCRDAAPMIAGLLFGGPAGIIAGVIGGVERWFAVYWGAGTFTRTACSVATVCAGLLAALVRRFFLENKRPRTGLALGAGIVAETFHLTLIFITNIDDASKAIGVVRACFWPMVIAVGVSTMLAALVVAQIADDYHKIFSRKKRDRQNEHIFDTIQRHLLLVVTCCLVVTSVFNFTIETNNAKNEIDVLLTRTVEEVAADVLNASDSNMLKITHYVANAIMNNSDYNLDQLAEEYSMSDVSIINSEGIIVESTNPSYLGYNMADGTQSSAFLCLNKGTQEYVQAFGPISQDANTYRKYAGVALEKGFVQTSYDGEGLQREMGAMLKSLATNRHAGDTGVVLVLDSDNKVISRTKDMSLSMLSYLITGGVDKLTVDDDLHQILVGQDEYYYVAYDMEGYKIITLYSVEDANESRDTALYLFMFCMILVFAVLYGLIYMLIKNLVVNQIVEMTRSLSNISQGNLDEVVDVRTNEEFSSLSDDINTTVSTLKRYIAEAAARIDKELEFAKAIQLSALPSTFPAFPKRKDFDIYARMDTAKEVGGDFYDFYMTDENTLNFLIADVSGKGIPAAMFMMRAKAELRSHTKSGLSVADVFTESNNGLCEGNDAEMFVTAWQGSLNLKTGHCEFANAGHNLPVVKHADGKFEFLQQKICLVLAGMEGIKYKVNEIDLQPGDRIYLYTDGVTEATDIYDQLYGDERLLECLNAKEYGSLKEMCDAVKTDIDIFVKGAAQFDDITMVALDYYGQH